VILRIFIIVLIFLVFKGFAVCSCLNSKLNAQGLSYFKDSGSDYLAFYVLSSKNVSDAAHISEFANICSELSRKVGCFVVDCTNSKDLDKSFIDELMIKNVVYIKDCFDKFTYRFAIVDKNMEVVYCTEDINRNIFNTVLSYYAGIISEKDFIANLSEKKNRNEISTISPDINFILKLYKKGEYEKAYALVDKLKNRVETDEAKLLVAEISLRIKYLKPVHEILESCSLIKCKFYEGVYFYLKKEYRKSLDILLGIYDRFEDKNDIKYYIRENYKALGDKENAEKFKD